ncbi:MAG: hypothetical protein IJQ31_03495 [Thermoguttaceae bacterium]|nr:hypothetical protein [Thermoguttaceae bacterium]
MKIPASEDWNWFGSQTAAELESLGVDSFNDTWILESYAWFWSRLPKSAQERFQPPVDGISPQGPPANLVPFPCAKLGDGLDSDAGIINFVSVDSKGSLKCEAEWENSSACKFAHEAALFVYQIFQKYDPTVGFPNVGRLPGSVEGGSIALSAMIAALCRILNVAVPDTIIATGCFQMDENGRASLKTVEPETLAQKLIASARLGFRKFFCVKDQKGFGGTEVMSAKDLLEKLKEKDWIPYDSELEIQEVSPRPWLALFEIARELPPSSGKELAEFLAELSHQYLWFEPSFTDLLETLAESSTRLVKHVALEMRSRAALHQGKTQEAQEFRQKVPPLEPTDFPFGPLGSFLKYEETSSRVIQKIDMGIWDETDPDVERMRRILRRQKDSIEDRIADIEDYRSALSAANTEARRLFFLGRLYRDENLLIRAWDELTAFQKYWQDIFEYTKRQHRSDETLQRQLNQCFECLEDYWVLTGKLLPAPFIPEDFNFSDDAPAYDLVAWLDWVLMYGKPENTSFGRFFKRADELWGKYSGYPNFKPYEKFLIYKLGTPEEQEHARSQLAQARHLNEPEDILAVIALRTASVLGNEALFQKALQAVPSSLRWLADELMKKPEEIVFRCPY